MLWAFRLTPSDGGARHVIQALIAGSSTGRRGNPITATSTG
jgi:hypothetical protein